MYYYDVCMHEKRDLSSYYKGSLCLIICIVTQLRQRYATPCEMSLSFIHHNISHCYYWVHSKSYLVLRNGYQKLSTEKTKEILFTEIFYPRVTYIFMIMIKSRILVINN